MSAASDRVNNLIAVDFDRTAVDGHTFKTRQRGRQEGDQKALGASDARSEGPLRPKKGVEGIVPFDSPTPLAIATYHNNPDYIAGYLSGIWGVATDNITALDSKPTEDNGCAVRAYQFRKEDKVKTVYVSYIDRVGLEFQQAIDALNGKNEQLKLLLGVMKEAKLVDDHTRIDYYDDSADNIQKARHCDIINPLTAHHVDKAASSFSVLTSYRNIPLAASSRFFKPSEQANASAGKQALLSSLRIKLSEYQSRPGKVYLEFSSPEERATFIKKLTENGIAESNTISDKQDTPLFRQAGDPRCLEISTALQAAIDKAATILEPSRAISGSEGTAGDMLKILASCDFMNRYEPRDKHSSDLTIEGSTVTFVLTNTRDTRYVSFEPNNHQIHLINVMKSVQNKIQGEINAPETVSDKGQLQIKRTTLTFDIAEQTLESMQATISHALTRHAPQDSSWKHTFDDKARTVTVNNDIQEHWSSASP